MEYDLMEATGDPNDDNNLVHISTDEYDELLSDSLLLEALRGAGVDNWDGWDDAIKTYNTMTEEAETSQ